MSIIWSDAAQQTASRNNRADEQFVPKLFTGPQKSFSYPRSVVLSEEPVVVSAG
jgi:hypothetical protein